MSPNTSPASPTVRITVEYGNDLDAGAETLLAVLRRATTPAKQETDEAVEESR
jgi:hypothetical protein